MSVTRISIRLSEEINEYFKKRSERTGQPVSSLISIAITEYVEGKLGMEAIQGLYAADKLVKKPETETIPD